MSNIKKELYVHHIAYNERYAKDISRKIRANLKFKISRGEYIGHAPYGYKKSSEVKNMLVIEESKADVIRQIFEMYKQGYGYSTISRILNSKGYSSPSIKSVDYTKGKGWNAVAVQRILCNRVYIGDTVQGVSEKISFKSKKTRRLPKTSWVITENTHEAIINKSDFEEVQRIRDDKCNKIQRYKGEINLFNSLLYCGNCGSAMYARKRKGYPTVYVCSSYAKGGKSKCSSHRISEEEIAKLIVDELKSIINKKVIVARLIELMREESADVRYMKRADELKKILAVKYKHQETLYIDKLEGRVSEQLFLRINSEIDNQIKNITREQSSLKNQDSLIDEEYIKNILKSIDVRNLNNEIIRTIVDRIIVYDVGDKLDPIKIEKYISMEDIKNINDYGGVIISYKCCFPGKYIN